MKNIPINSETSIESVCGWLENEGEEIEFKLYPRSGFAFAAESIACLAVRELARKNHLFVICTYDVFQDASGSHFGLFDGLFGITLAIVARRVIDPFGVDIRKAIVEHLWQRMLQNNGVMGVGRGLSVLSRDPDISFPSIFLSWPDSVPTRDQFSPVLHKLASSLGFGTYGSKKRTQLWNAEQDLLTFLYEASINAYEHGNMLEQRVSTKGIRGIIVERLGMVSLDEIKMRKSLPDWQRSYLRRIESRITETRRVMCITVYDLGIGIQNTLPELDGESELARLNRAFESGVTSKANFAGFESGQGLFKIGNAASQLNALLIVKSAEILAYADFSQGQSKFDVRLEPWPHKFKLPSEGTSLSLIWPDYVPTQREL